MVCLTFLTSQNCSLYLIRNNFFTFEPVAMQVQRLPGCSVACLLKPHTDDSGLSPATRAGEAAAREHPLGVVKQWRKQAVPAPPPPPALTEGKQISPDQSLCFSSTWLPACAEKYCKCGESLICCDAWIQCTVCCLRQQLWNWLLVIKEASLGSGVAHKEITTWARATTWTLPVVIDWLELETWLPSRLISLLVMPI